MEVDKVPAFDEMMQPLLDACVFHNGRFVVTNFTATSEDKRITLRIWNWKTKLPDRLVKEATALGVLSSEHIEMLLCADILAQLAAMANDPNIKRLITQIEAKFSTTEADELN